MTQITHMVIAWLQENWIGLVNIVIIWIIAQAIWGSVKSSKARNAEWTVRQIEDVTPLFMVVTASVFWIFGGDTLGIMAAWVLLGLKFNLEYYRRKQEKQSRK